MITFRTATADDLPAIVRLLADDERGAQRERPADPLPQAYRDGFAAMVRQEGNRMIVAEADGVVVGCLQLMLLPGISHLGMLRAEVESVRVASSRRGQGIGSLMLRHAIGLAREAGAGVVQLTTNAGRVDAQRFYKSLGFEASHVGMKFELQ